MKKLTVLSLIVSQSLLVLILGSSAAFAEEQRPFPDFDIIISQLDINEEKAQKLRAMMEQHRIEMDKRHEQKRQEHEQNRFERDQHREELYNLIGAENMYKFDNYMKQFRPKGPERPQ